MTKSDLVAKIASSMMDVPIKNIDAGIKSILEQMSTVLAQKERMEIRGFGSFSLHYRKPRQARNPKTGDAVTIAARYYPHFKVGKELRNRVNVQIEADQMNFL